MLRKLIFYGRLGTLQRDQPDRIVSLVAQGWKDPKAAWWIKELGLTEQATQLTPKWKKMCQERLDAWEGEKIGNG